jgi:hypothetical protein
VESAVGIVTIVFRNGRIAGERQYASEWPLSQETVSLPDENPYAFLVQETATIVRSIAHAGVGRLTW